MAARELASQGIAMSVWSAHCLKPFDDETTFKLARESDLLVTVEDHSVIGGLGTCVAEALATNLLTPAFSNSACKISLAKAANRSSFMTSTAFRPK